MRRLAEGSVFQEKDGKRWVARLRYTDAAGNRREKKRFCTTHKQAAAKVQELKAEIADEKRDRKTYSELDAWYRARYVHAAKFVGENKVSGYRQPTAILEVYLDRALEYFKTKGDPFVDEISYGDCEDYKLHVINLKTRHGRPRSVADINHHLKQVRRLLNKAREKKWLTDNPFGEGDPLIITSHENERIRVLSRTEEAALLTACDRFRQHLKPVIVFAIETALRRNELQRIEWKDVDVKERSIRVVSLNSKTLKPRMVPMSARCSEVLAQLWQNSRKRPSDEIFGPSDFKKAFNGACRDAELNDVHFHDLRHTAITRWLEKGASITDAMKASGHSQTKTFLRYVNQTQESVKEFAMKLDRAA